jgi:hypothetical protein
LIVEDYTVGSATLPGKSAVLNYTENGAGTSVLMFLGGRTSDYVAAEPWRIDFDMLADSNSVGANNTLSFRIQNLAGGLLANIVFQPDGDLQIISDTNNSTYSNLWSLDTVENFTAILDPSSREVRAYFGGTLVAAQSIGAAFLTEDLGVHTASFRPGSTNGTFIMGIDNIVTSIPEPSSVAALFGAVALLMVVRRRK